jgi:transposase InsO family protein
MNSFLADTGRKEVDRRLWMQTTNNMEAKADKTLKVYEKHTQANAIDFIDHIIEKFPFRIREVRTDNGHEFQAKFHWHVEDLGIRHAYIKRGTPQLNGKVERSYRSDQQEFYQLLSYKGDVDLEAKLDEWERFDLRP